MQPIPYVLERVPLRAFLDPPLQYTGPAYRERVGLTCAEISFRDVASGALPSEMSELCPGNVRDHGAARTQSTMVSAHAQDRGEPVVHDKTEGEVTSRPTLDMVICSFALHLVETPSQLFSLLSELSQKTRWLIIVAPHKKPDVGTARSLLEEISNEHVIQIKNGWGWLQWNIGKWKSLEHGEREPDAEILEQRYIPGPTPPVSEADEISLESTYVHSEAPTFENSVKNLAS